MLKLIITFCLIAIHSSQGGSRRHLSESEYKYKFSQFVEKYNKVYDSALEWAGRYETFKNNLDEIHYHNNFRNSTFTKGNSCYILWLIKFCKRNYFF